jgi:vacuolar protein sorting-associated protein 13A/C
VIDSGRVEVRSELVGKDRKKEVENMHGRQVTSEELKQLEELMYDRFNVELSSVQVVVGQSVEACLNIVRTPDSDDPQHVLNRVNMEFLVETSILSDAYDLPAFKISGRLPLLHINFSDLKYRTIMNILDLISPPQPDAAARPESTISQTFNKVDRRFSSILRGDLTLEDFEDEAIETIEPQPYPIEEDAEGDANDQEDDDTFYDAEERLTVGWCVLGLMRVTYVAW